ncbi:receptor-type adenylate cyclase [Trypanosoma cruzi]|nr:receptor-type adenylate cyclase [Trypanosoma cruzi]
MAVEWVAVWPREQRACAASRCLFFALLLLLDLPYAVAQPSGGDRVVKVVSFEFGITLLDAFSRNIMAGFNASLHSRNNSIMNGVRVEIVEKKTKFTNYASDLSAALKADNDIFAVVGHCGDKLLLNIKDVLAERDVVAFSPFTGSSLVRGWNPNFYFLRAEPAAELLALLRHALAHLRVRRLGFMYLQGVSFGDREYAQAQRVMSRMGYELSGVFSVESSVTGVATKVFDAAWEAFAETRPQAVIVFGSPINDTAKFVKRMLTDRRTAGAYLLAPSVLQDIVLRVWRAAVAGGVEFVPGQVITTGTNPLAKDTQYEAIQRFQEVMRAYLTHSGQKYYADKDHFLKDDGDGEMMVAGWIAGEVLSQALGSREWVKDRKSFLASLYNQRRYVVDDIVIGDYGGECKAGAASQGAACRCNQGGRTVYIKKFVESFRAVYADWGTLVVPLSECEASGLMLRGTLNGVTFMLVDVPPVSKVISELRKGFYGGRMVHNAFLLTSDEVSMQLISSTRNGAPDALRETMKAKRVDFVSGVVTEAMLEMEGVTFIDPLLLEPRLNRFRKNVIRLSPTLEQQFFVLAEYLGNASGGSVHAVIRNREASAMADVLRRSLLTFGVSLASATLLAGGDALVDHLPVEGDVFVVGLSAGDAGAIARHVSSHGGVRVFVVFLEFALLHAEFVAAFRDGAGADRVVFATSLPHWNDEDPESENARKFAAAVPREEDRTPLSLMSFAATRLVHTALSRMHHVSAEQLADLFYNNVAVAVDDDMLYGPFADGRACPATESGAGCGRNYGATRISVWPLARALDPAVPELSPAVTPSMKYADPAAGGLTARLLIGVFAGCAAALLLVAVLRYFCRSSRDNANAPKERTDPVTLVFTDIESSTALWAACPETMPDAVATHHRLIRSLIAKYRCYEVKTIGDAFMIACKSAFAAVQLVRELQQVFLQHDWGTSVIDDAYRMFEEDRAEEDAEYVPPTARLDAAVYRQYWNGLRVRVGVHTGLCDIRRDEVTKGYDYYGGTSNMAARTESVGNGGQVLLTRAAYFALSTAEREQVEVTALGAVALRGVPKPVEMYQLDTVPGRVVAGLRLDRDDAAVDDYSDCGSVSSGVSRNTCYDSAVSFISGLMSPYASRQRAGVLESLCRRWRVRMVEKGVMSYDDYCAALVERLAGRVGRVLGPCGWVFGGSLAEIAATSAVSSQRQSRIRSFHSLGRSGSYSCTELSSVVFPVDGPEACHKSRLFVPLLCVPPCCESWGGVCMSLL